MACYCRTLSVRRRAGDTDRVCLTRKQGLRLLDWHNGQGSALYAVGSNALSGRCVSKSSVRQALAELRLAMYSTPARAQKSATTLVHTIAAKLRTK